MTTTPTGRGKTRDTLLNSAGTIPTGFDAERLEYLSQHMRAAANNLDPIKAGEHLVMIGLEEVRRTCRAIRAIGMDPPVTGLEDSRTGAVICTSADDDYLERYRAYMAAHPAASARLG